MTRRKRSSAKRAPYRVAIMGEWLTLNRGTGQAYFLVFDPDRGAKVRCYMGRMLAEDGELNPKTLERAQRWLTERVTRGTGSLHPDRDGELTVAQVVKAFVAERETFAGASELGHFKNAFETLTELYGSQPAHTFGPLALRAVRDRMIASGRLNRKTLNNRVERIKMLFKWAASLEMVPANVNEALRTVEGVRKGRVDGLREPRKVDAVPDEHVDAVLDLLPAQVAAIVEVMRWTGARCGEVVQMRPADVDRSREPWVYTPPTHKTEHHGHDRRV